MEVRMNLTRDCLRRANCRYPGWKPSFDLFCDLEHFERIWAEALFATCHATPIFTKSPRPTNFSLAGVLAPTGLQESASGCRPLSWPAPGPH